MFCLVISDKSIAIAKGSSTHHTGVEVDGDKMSTSTPTWTRLKKADRTAYDIRYSCRTEPPIILLTCRCGCTCTRWL